MAHAAGSRMEDLGANSHVERMVVESRPSGGPQIRLRGLPFDATVQDVLSFLALHGIVDKVADIPNAAELVPTAPGRPSGQAVVSMRGLQDAMEARDVLDGKYFGSRWIEVFVSGATKGEERRQRPARVEGSGHEEHFVAGRRRQRTGSVATAATPAAAWKEGDWGCPNCGDHQFARNVACRQCGAAKPAGSGGLRGRGPAIPPPL